MHKLASFNKTCPEVHYSDPLNYYYYYYYYIEGFIKHKFVNEY